MLPPKKVRQRCVSFLAFSLAAFARNERANGLFSSENVPDDVRGADALNLG